MKIKKHIFTFLFGIALTSCNAQKSTEHQQTETMPKHTNALANESSPYLLQHAHNPVNWMPWGEEALSKAKKEDKPILVSIGYAACHWCHVMEHESFENEDVAAVMNEHFICIKVDREERPDVDQIYMDALQAMGQQGGWPLNVFLTSDAKPFYGGTYFPPTNWMKICDNIAEAYKTRRAEINESAEKITQGIATSQFAGLNVKSETEFKQQTLDLAFHELEKGFDNQHGGFGGAPKFPMLCNYSFLMHYYNLSEDKRALEMVNKTLTEMAWGGIYDQVGGGFARYSTDARWFAPHFEKMLYDNGQLVSIFSQAYQITKNELYKDVVNETVDFTLRELTSNEGGFYSSLDADSEGKEGKFYCWSEEELKSLIGNEFELFKKYYNTTSSGNWEHSNILYRNVSDKEFCKKNNIEMSSLNSQISNWKKTLLKERTKRIRPGLDDKILASWNGLMLTGLCDAYKALGDDKFLKAAIKNADFIAAKMIVDGKLYHNYKNGKATIDGYLEDYAIVSQALTNLYQVTFDEKYLRIAKELTDYSINNFYDTEEEMFFFTDANSEKLIARKKEFFDNVIPASNSIMADNLHTLGLYFDDNDYQEMSNMMTSKMSSMLQKSIRYTGNWAMVYSKNVEPTAEVAIVGNNWKEKLAELQSNHLPNTIFMGGEKESKFIPLLEGKTGGKEAMIYVCYNKTCQLPVESVEKAIEQIK